MSSASNDAFTSIKNDINISHNVIRSAGHHFEIEVVPDGRFPLYAFTEYTQRVFSSIDFCGHSCVTPASMVGYMMYMLHAFVFLTDCYDRRTPSDNVLLCIGSRW